MNSRRWLGLLSIGLLIPLLSSLAHAQSTGTTTGDVKGRVVDDKQLPLPGVTVTATNKDTGASRSTVSKLDGDYVIALLPPGMYTIKAEVALFNPVTYENVRLSLGQTTSRDFTLAITASTSAAVEVTAEAPLIDPSKTDLSATIDRAKLESLPNIQRNFLSFALITPRVSEDKGPQTGVAASSGFSINGQSPRLNNLAVDGFDNNDQATGSVRATFSQDAVQEYQVITNPYASEFGRTAGGVVNIITRSGTNDFKGSVFYFYRGDSLSSSDPLTGEKIPLKDNRFGASLGGRLVKDRTFFFGAYEHQGTDTANAVTIADADVALIRSKGFAIENGNVPYEVRNDNVVVKLDHQFNPSNVVTLRGNWSKGDDENSQAWGGLFAKSFGGVRDSKDTAGALAFTSVLGATSFNEFRALYSANTYNVESLDPNHSPNVTLPGVATFGTQRFLPSFRDTKILQIFDSFSFEPGTSGNVRLKAGFEYYRVGLTGALPNYSTGLYRFVAQLPASLGGLNARQAFAAGIPAQFIQSFGDPNGEGNAQEISGFVQADLNLSSNFLVRLGVRYDYEKPIEPFPTDSNNFAPRFSFSWGPTESLKIKGGYGRFFGVGAVGPMFAVQILDEGRTRLRLQIRGLGVGPQSAWPTVPWALPDRRYASEPATIIPPAVLRAGPFESAYTDQASLGLELSLGKKLLVSLDGVYARGNNIFVTRDANALGSDPLPAPQNPRYPDPRFTSIFQYESTGNSWYKGGTIGLQSRFGGFFEFTAFYTRADAEDDYVDWLTEYLPQDSVERVDSSGNVLGPASERGPSVQSPEQKFNLSATFSTVGRSDLGAFARDWTFSTIVDWQNGRHTNILLGADRNNNGDGASDRPVGVGRNSGSLGSQFTLDLRLSRRITIDQDFGFDLIGVCTNVTNEENVVAIQNVQNSPGFGNPTLFAPSRIFQLGARINF